MCINPSKVLYATDAPCLKRGGSMATVLIQLVFNCGKLPVDEVWLATDQSKVRSHVLDV